MARNLITNPSAEVDTTGWTGESGTVTRVTDVAAVGAASFALEAAHASWGYGGSAAAKNAASAPLIDLGALGVARCLWLPGTAGNFVSTPDDPSHRVTGDLDLRARLAMEDWTPAGAFTGTILSRRDTTNYGFGLRFQNGRMVLYWRETSGGAGPSATCTADVPFTDGQLGWVRITLDVDNGAAGHTVRFYTSTDGVAWTQLGADVVTAGVTSIFAAVVPLTIGGHADGNESVKGKVISAEVRAGIGGAVVAAYDATAHTGITYTDSTGKVWTISRSGDATAEIVDRNTWAFTGTEYLTLPDRNELDFGSGEALSVAVQVMSRASATRLILGKKVGGIGIADPGWILQHSSDGNTYLDLYDGTARSYDPEPHTAGVFAVRAGDRSGGRVRTRVGGVSASDAADATASLANTAPMQIGSGGGSSVIFAGLIRWVALFRRVLTATEHSALAAWNGTVATEPNWLRDAAVLYINADDSAQRSSYTSSNSVLNLAANPSLVGAAVAVAAAQKVHLSATALTAIGGIQRTLASGIRWLDSGGATISEVTGVEVAANGARAALEAIAPTGAMNFKPVFSSPNLRAGDGLRVDAAMAVTSAYRGAYFDGSSPGARWAGTAHASISILPEVIATPADAEGRIGIDLVDFADDDDRTIWRIGTTGAREAVRSADPAPISGGAYFAWDYEAPISELVHYEVDATTTYASAKVSLGATLPWLRSPYLPSVNRNVRVTSKPQRSRSRPRQVIPILNSDRPVVRYGQLQAESGRVRFWTKTDQEAEELVVLLEQGIVQLAIPQERFGTQYLSLGEVTEEPATAYADGSDSSKVSWWSVEYTVVGRPVGEATGGANTTWQAVRDRHATWQEVRDTYASWLVLLRGVVE